MLKKTITYKDLDDNPITEDFYFNLSDAEIAEMQFAAKGGLSESLKAIVSTGDASKIIDTFKWILSKAYGKRSDDNKRFIKSPELWEEFTQTDAFSVLFLELVTDAEKSAEFIRGVVSKEIADKIPNGIESVPDVLEDTIPAWVRENREPTSAELTGMSKDQLIELMKNKTH